MLSKAGDSEGTEGEGRAAAADWRPVGSALQPGRYGCGWNERVMGRTWRSVFGDCSPVLRGERLSTDPETGELNAGTLRRPAGVGEAPAQNGAASRGPCQWPFKTAHIWPLKSAQFCGAAAEGA